MPCPQCQHENPAEATFCLNCGTRLARVCSQCQHVLPPEAKFCIACGHALTATSAPGTQLSQAESAPPARHTPEAERRQLTVMFCDLVESTALSGQLDPEELREIIRAYQAACTDVIQRFDGYVAQLLGDGLLVYFGYPQAHEDDAQRAVLGGLGMLNALSFLNARLEREQGVKLAIRVGIHTGLVVVGEMGGEGRQEQLALGETPNIASRLQGLAEPDTLMVSEATYRLIQGYFDCDILGAYELRGVSQPIPVYQVLQESGAQSRLDAVSSRGLTPLVGRNSELQLLRDRWNQVKSGEGQVVVLNAEPGLGKSRMVQALKEDLVDESYTRLECRSSPYYQNTALYPLIDLFQRMLGWEQNESTDEKLGRLEQALPQYRLPIEETVPLMAGLLSLSLPEDRYPRLNWTPQRQRQQTLETIVAIILELAEREPVLFILEDLHWTDPSTIELLELLIAQTPTSRLHALLTCRPEFASPFGNRSYLTQITLNRLAHHDIAHMVHWITDEKPIPSEVVQQIVEKTDGVPLFIEEMTKSVLESGVLKELDDRYELVDAVSSLAIPSTLQDSLMARLDRLVTAKGVAQYGAVIGRQFSYELLQAVSQLDEAMLRHELGRLVESELVYQRGLPPQATYTFKHTLIQDAAYESLLRGTRQGYHRRIAEVLRDQFPEIAEAQPELLAHHYTEGRLNEEAVRYWQQAGERAVQRSASMEAVSHLTRGLDLLATLPDTPERVQGELMFHILRGISLIVTKGWGAPEVERTYARAHELCRHLGESPQLFTALAGLAAFYTVRAEWQVARDLGAQLLCLAQSQSDTALLLFAHHAMGFIVFCQGDLALARTHLEQGMSLYDPQQHGSLALLYGLDPGVGNLSFLAITLWILGCPDQALRKGQEALELAHALSHPYSLAFALTWAAILHQVRRDHQATQEQAEAASTVSTEQGFSLYLAGSMIWQGWAQAMQGREAEGIAQISQGIETWTSTGAVQAGTWHGALLAEAYGKAGQVEDGLTALEEAFALLQNHGERFYEAELYRLQGELLLHTVYGMQSAEWTPEMCFQRAIEVARGQQAKSWELRASTSLARLWQQQDKRQDAYDLLVPVYGWFTEGFDTADLQDAQQLLDELSADIGSPTV
jgi:class 3 adenylate cyclase/predicted ATPase